MSTSRKSRVPLPNTVIIRVMEFAGSRPKTLAVLELTSRFCRSYLLRDPKNAIDNETWSAAKTKKSISEIPGACEYISPWQMCFKSNFEPRYMYLLRTQPQTPNKSGKDPTLHIDAKKWKQNYQEELKIQDFEAQMLIDTSPYVVEHQYLAHRKKELDEYYKNGKYYTNPNVLVLGDHNTGKSSLARQFVYGQFYDWGGLLPKDTMHNILLRDEHRISSSSIDYVWVEIQDSQNASCMLEPIKGQWPRTDQWVYGKSDVLRADCFIIMFDITRKETYYNYVDKCVERIMTWRHLDEPYQVPILLVANKCDLDYFEIDVNMEDIRKDAAERFDNAFEVVEMSCKRREDVIGVIQKMIKQYRITKKKNGFHYSNHHASAVQKITSNVLKLF